MATKYLVVARARKRIFADWKRMRAGRKLTQINAEYLLVLEAHASMILRKLARNEYGQKQMQKTIERASGKFLGLVAKNKVKQSLLEHMRRLYPWCTVTNIGDDAVIFIEQQIHKRIQADIHSHPSVGKTFNP